MPPVTGCLLPVASFLIQPGLVRISVSLSQQCLVPEVLTPGPKLGEGNKGWTTHGRPPSLDQPLLSTLAADSVVWGCIASPASLPPSLRGIFSSSSSPSSPLHFLVSKDCMSHFTLSCQMSNAVGLRGEASFFPLLKESSGLKEAPNTVILLLFFFNFF